MLPLLPLHVVGLVLFTPIFVIVGQQVATVAVTALEAALKHPLVDLPYK
jgi:hypothetical protein